MRVMPTTNLKMKAKQTAHSSRPTRQQSKTRRKKRKLSCSPVDELVAYSSRKRQKRQPVHTNEYFYQTLCTAFHENAYNSQTNDRFVIQENLVWKDVKYPATESRNKAENNVCEHLRRSFTHPETQLLPESKCWIDELPQEIMLKIFNYLPLGMLLHSVPRVCKKWEALALDWTLWKAVEDLTIKNMVISTNKLRTLLRTIPKLKKLELFSRNDTEELLHEVFDSHRNLEVLKLDRCFRSTLQVNMLSQTVTSVLELCPKLKTIILSDTYFHSKAFYKCLAKKFKSIERINVTCTSKSEMNVFVKHLKETVSEVEFQKVPMMGRAAGKQIYWGPILGLVVRPVPISPFHQQCIHDNFPNYAF